MPEANAPTQQQPMEPPASEVVTQQPVSIPEDLLCTRVPRLLDPTFGFLPTNTVVRDVDRRAPDGFRNESEGWLLRITRLLRHHGILWLLLKFFLKKAKRARGICSRILAGSRTWLGDIVRPA